MLVVWQDCHLLPFGGLDTTTPTAHHSATTVTQKIVAITISNICFCVIVSESSSEIKATVNDEVRSTAKIKRCMQFTSLIPDIKQECLVHTDSLSVN